MAELEAEVKTLSERKRRAYYRYLEKLEGNHKKKKKQPNTGSEGEVCVWREGEEGKAEEEEDTMNMDEYFRNAREKLEELMKGIDDEFYEHLEDLNLSSDDGCDDEEDDSDDDF